MLHINDGEKDVQQAAGEQEQNLTTENLQDIADDPEADNAAPTGEPAMEAEGETEAEVTEPGDDEPAQEL